MEKGGIFQAEENDKHSEEVTGKSIRINDQKCLRKCTKINKMTKVKTQLSIILNINGLNFPNKNTQPGRLE